MHNNQTEHDFLIAFGAVQAEVHQNAINKGWWDNGESVIDCLMKAQSELSEAYEGFISGDTNDKHCGKFSPIEVELADVVLVIMNLCEKQHYRLAEAILAKPDITRGASIGMGNCFRMI